MLNNITNFFNLIKTGMVKTQLEAKDVIPIGTKDASYGGTYKPTLIEYANFVAGLVGGSNGQVLFNDNDTIAGASNLYWDKVNERVGIGTSTPTTQMQIVGTSNASILTLTSGIRNADIAVYGSGSLFEIGTQASYSLSFKTNSTGRMIIYGGGNVGIGTATDAGFLLDVNGTARVGTLRLNSVGDTIEFNNTLVRIRRSSNRMNFEAFDGFDFTDTNISATRIRIFGTTGNVAINTTTDAGFRLDVNGTARVQGATTLAGTNTLSGTTNISGLFSNWACHYSSSATSKPLSFSAQSGGATPNNVAIQFGFNFRAAGGLYSQDIFQNILYDNTANNIVTGFEWFTHQKQIGDLASVLAMSLRGKTLSLGTNTPSESSLLQMDSTTQGFLPPRMTNAERTAIASPAVGLMVYQTDGTEGLYIYKSTGWALNS